MSLLKKILDNKIFRLRIPFGHPQPDCISDFHQYIDEIINEWNKFKQIKLTTGIPIDDVSYEQKLLNDDKKWKAVFLYGYEYYTNVGLDYFPITSQIVKKWENDITLVFFSTLEPGKRIPPHVGNNHGVVRSQIGIDIKDYVNTGLRVVNNTVQLKNKEIFVFDDTFEHEAWNCGTLPRTVLIIDTPKKLPHIYNILNKFWLSKMKKSTYVQNALINIKKQSF